MRSLFKLVTAMTAAFLLSILGTLATASASSPSIILDAGSNPAYRSTDNAGNAGNTGNIGNIGRIGLRAVAATPGFSATAGRPGGLNELDPTTVGGGGGGATPGGLGAGVTAGNCCGGGGGGGTGGPGGTSH